MTAATSSTHLAALRPPFTLRRLYIVRDNDAAGEGAVQRLSRSALCVGIEPVVLTPTLKDFNDDLRAFGVDGLRTMLLDQLRPEDAGGSWRSRPGEAAADAAPLQPDRGDDPPGESRARGPARGRSDGRRAAAATAGGDYFPPPERPRGAPALHRETK